METLNQIIEELKEQGIITLANSEDSVLEIQNNPKRGNTIFILNAEPIKTLKSESSIKKLIGYYFDMQGFNEIID